VRGAGLLAGIELDRDATDVVAAALDKGLLVNRTATSVVRLLPPYIVTERDVDEAIGILDAVLKERVN
jgi:acetylornithine/succinyldiaminopimelate/putrescine aminotransferase